MGNIWQSARDGAAGAAAFLWERTGTLAAVALLAGTAGMGAYHLMQENEPAPRVACYAGARDLPGAQPPQGVLPLAPAGDGYPAVPHVRLESSPGGRVTRLLHVDADGRPAPIPGSRVAEQRMVYDAAGHLVRKCNYNAEGSPEADVDGVAESRFTYDTAGRLVAEEFRDAAGRVVLPHRPGYARMELQYDARGRVAEIRYLDAGGMPVTNARGEQHVVFSYDDARHTTVRRNLVAGKPADNLDGVAELRECATADGTTLRRSWYNAAGEPVPGAPQQVAAVQVSRAEDGSTECTRYCSSGGGLCASCRVCAERVVRRFPDSRTEWECYNAADGLPCNNPAAGYAEHVTEFGEDGKPEREFFWDAAGHPCHCFEKHHVAVDGARYVLARYRDGSSEFRPE